MDSENHTDVESAVLKCWYRRTKTEKASIIFGFLLLFLVATVVISLNATSYFVTKSVLERIDFSVDPCVDFYQFACGKFMNRTRISDVKLFVTAYTELEDKVQEQLRSLISENIDESDPAPFNLAKKVYKKCINTPINNSLNDIKNEFDGWPIEKANERNWIQIIKANRNFGYETDSILDVVIRIDTDLKNSTSINSFISQPKFGIDQKYLLIGLNSGDVRKYYNEMVELAVFFGSENPRAKILMKESVQFEMELAKISLSIEKLRNISTLANLFTLREVQEKYTYIEWTKYINAFLPYPFSVDENEVVVVKTPSFFDNLGELLNKTPPHVIANYVMWRAINTNVKLIRVQQNEIECMGIVGKKFPVAVSAMYVRNFLVQNWKEAASSMVNRIRNEFELILKNADWMDENTRKMALQKLDAMITRIGYPNMLLDDTKIEEYYKHLEMDESTYISSILSIVKFDINRKLIKPNKPVERDEWDMTAPPFNVNAHYLLNKNGIQIPAAILQEPFFSYDRPWYMNFAAIGSFIGHEIVHGFDDMGAQFDMEGKLMDWWKPETKAKYLQRTKCIIEQYGNYTDESTGLKINGINTQGENIADNGGFKASYLAYQKWEKENGVEPKLTRLNYTSQQMFWISAAQTWCSVSRKKLMNDMITTDHHSPFRFRVIGSFSNSKEFARDFQCPTGSKMNPVKKCEVW